MSRRRYRYIPTADGGVQSVEVSPDYTGNGEPGGGRLELMLDGHYDGLRATDGTDISTRRRHQEYMRQHGLTTADDYKQSWAAAAKKRADYFTTGGDHRQRREAVERAIHKLERGGKPNRR